MESFTLFIYRISDAWFRSWRRVCHLFFKVNLFSYGSWWNPSYPLLKKKRLDSLHFSSFTWLFELITVSSFSTKSFHSDIVHMPKSLDRGQWVSDLDAWPHWTWSTLSSVVPLHMGIPRKRKSGADTHCVLSRSELWDRKSFLWLWN